MTSDTRLASLRASVDRYIETVTALSALISVLTWVRGEGVQTDRRASIGRRMDGAGTTVTPDLVVQLSRKLGLVAEAKNGLPHDEALWAKVVVQLQSYDVPLKGWWTNNEDIESHDVALLVNQLFGARFASYIERWERENKSFRNGLCIIEFNHSSESRGQRLFLRSVRGTSMRHADINERLARGIPINMEHVVATYGWRRFYDAEPDTEYLMEVIWMDFVVPARAGKAKAEGEKFISLPMKVTSVTESLQSQFGSGGDSKRDVEYPKESWVREAFNRFVALRLARRVDQDNYIFLYRDIHGDVLKRFTSYKPKSAKAKILVRKGRRKGKRDPRQIGLFE